MSSGDICNRNVAVTVKDAARLMRRLHMDARVACGERAGLRMPMMGLVTDRDFVIEVPGAGG